MTIRDPEMTVALNSNMEQVLIIYKPDGDKIVLTFTDPDMLTGLSRQLEARAIELKTAQEYGMDFDETMEFFEKVYADEEFEYEVGSTDLDTLIHQILGEEQ